MSIKLVTDDSGIKVYSRDIEWSGGTFKKYSVGINKKDQKTGEWLTTYADVRFRKGVDVNNKALIRIKDSFPNMYKSAKDGKTYLEWFITEFDLLEDGEKPADAPAESFDAVPIGEDSELPFV